jgi:predicted DNA-binding transcriptional regulator
MKNMKVLVVVTLLLVLGEAVAQKKTFIREYNYKAGETDSKVSARQKALSEVKALLIEELGTYVESYVNYQVAEANNKITKDFFTSEIKTLSSGTTETRIIEETWTGYEYYVKAQITADPEEVLRRINETLSKRKSSVVIDSLHRLLKSSQDELALKGKELDQLRVEVAREKAEAEAKSKSLSVLNQQLAKTRQELASFQVEEKKILSEIEAIEQNIKNATKKASNARMGMTPEEVLRVCGRPRSSAGVEGYTHFYNYGNVWVMFESNTLTSLFDSKYWVGPGAYFKYKEHNILTR